MSADASAGFLFRSNGSAIMESKYPATSMCKHRLARGLRLGLQGGIHYRDGFVLVADQEGIWRVPHVSGAVRAGRADQPKISDVPPEQRKPVPAAYGQEMITQRGVFSVVAGHQNRHLALDPKTGAMFVGVGSTGNIGVEPEVKASIQRFEPDGSSQTTFASGMRNPTTLAFHPTTGELYAGV
jgi:hypothetical protein